MADDPTDPAGPETDVATLAAPDLEVEPGSEADPKPSRPDAGDGEPDANDGSSDDGIEALVDELTGKEPAEPPAAEEAPKDKADEAKPAEEPAPEAPKAEDGDPKPEDLLRFPKKPREQIKRLLDQRSELRKEVEQLKPQAEVHQMILADAREAGLARETPDGRLDTRGFKAWMDIAKDVNSAPPEQAAQRLRQMADRIHKLPDPEPAGPATFTGDLPPDLRDLVEYKTLSENEARIVAAARLTQVKQAAKPEPKPEVKPEPPPKPAGPTQQDRETAGLRAVTATTAKLEKELKLEWGHIREAVAQAVDRDVTELGIPPEKWAALTERKAREILAARQAAGKRTPTRQPAPSSSSRKPAPTEADPYADIVSDLTGG